MFGMLLQNPLFIPLVAAGFVAILLTFLFVWSCTRRRIVEKKIEVMKTISNGMPLKASDERELPIGTTLEIADDHQFRGYLAVYKINEQGWRTQDEDWNADPKVFFVQTPFEFREPLKTGAFIKVVLVTECPGKNRREWRKIGAPAKANKPRSDNLAHIDNL